MSEPALDARRVHVLDTAAVYLLVKQQNRSTLGRALAAPGQEVFVPAIVLLEAEQAEAIAKKRLEALEEYAQVDERLPRRLIERASAALRDVNRERCQTCSGFTRPSLVDAVVVVYAANIAEGDDRVTVDVHTDDVADLERLRSVLGARVTIRKC